MATRFERSAEPFEGKVAHVMHTGHATIATSPPGPPNRIDGYTLGVIPRLAGPPPHRGEMHPDGDEILYLVSGEIEITLDDGDEETIGVATTVVMRGGDAFVVPRGVWHQIHVVEPAYFVHLTPGPNGNARSL